VNDYNYEELIQSWYKLQEAYLDFEQTPYSAVEYSRQ
jgi:hypothetical protein